MVLHFGNYTVDVDVEKTRAIYEKLPAVSHRCSCDGCRNFEKAADCLPAEVGAFFSALGVDLKKITECYVNCTNADGTLLYGGFGHLCGTLVKGESAWVKVADAHAYYYNPDLAYRVSDRFRVSFLEECCLVEKEFEAPVLQFEIDADLPWLLEKENTYPQCAEE